MARPDRTPVLSVGIHDCEVQDFTAGGKGGQHQNRSNTGIRVIHHPSGARGESREGRSQLQNKRAAFRRMAESVEFRKWIARSLASGPTPEEQVEKDLYAGNLKIEYRREGEWMEVR